MHLMNFVVPRQKYRERTRLDDQAIPSCSPICRRLVTFLAILMLVAMMPARAQNDFIGEVTPLPVGRGFHGSAVLGDFLYVFGGSVSIPGQPDVEALTSHVAKILPSGDLTNFVATSRLNEPRHYIENSSIVYNDTVYVFGGSSGILTDDCVSTVTWSRPLPNGMLGPWNNSKPFSEKGLQCLAAFTTPGYMHLTGGLQDDNTITNKVWSVRINPDGSLGEWEAGPSLPEPLWFHCAQAVGGKAYVFGGLNDNETGKRFPSDRIYSSSILSTGQLGQWQLEPLRLPTGMYSGTCAVAGPYLFYITPRYQGAVVSPDIWWTYVTPQGMRPWERRATEIESRVYRASATDYRRGIIYITGGKPRTGVSPHTHAYAIRLSGKARDLAEQAWLAQQGQRVGSTSQIDYAGGRTRLSFDTANSVAGTIPGFYTLDAAREECSRSRKPLVMYFNIAEVPTCQQQLEVIQTEGFSALTQKVVFASVSPQDYPQLAQQYGVFRVPTWILYNSTGIEQGRGVGVQDIEVLTRAVDGLK